MLLNLFMLLTYDSNVLTWALLFCLFADTGQGSYVYLETIVEETSDDLRSESEYSAGGWPDTDSDAGSVIHLPLVVGEYLCIYSLLLQVASSLSNLSHGTSDVEG